MKNKEWNYCPDDVHIIRMSIVYDEKGNAVAVKKDDNGVPLFFDDLAFRDWWYDEFHPFAILWNDDEPLAICYSPDAAVRLHLTLLMHYAVDASISTVPYDKPQRFGDDDYSRHLREYLYMDDFLESKGLKSEDMIKYGNTEEFKEFAKAKDMELKARIKNTSELM